MNIIMRVLTSAGYEPMYPFNPSLVLNSTFDSTSTSTAYKISVTGIDIPLTNTIASNMGIIAFTPTVTNADNITLSLNGDTAKPILFADGVQVRANTLVAGRLVLVKYFNNNFYLIIDKNQVGLGNVDNTSDVDKPISTSVTTALNQKMNIPTLIPRNSNLNNYRTAGFFYNNSSSDVATITNVAAQQPFSLLVEQNMGIKQTFSANTTGGIQVWVRNLVGNAWTSWYQQTFTLYGENNPTEALGVNGNLYVKINN